VGARLDGDLSVFFSGSVLERLEGAFGGGVSARDEDA